MALCLKDTLPRRNSLQQRHSKQLKRLVPDSLYKGLDGRVGPAGCRSRPFERLPPILGQVRCQRGIVELKGARKSGHTGQGGCRRCEQAQQYCRREGPRLCTRAAAAAAAAHQQHQEQLQATNAASHFVVDLPRGVGSVTAAAGLAGTAPGWRLLARCLQAGRRHWRAASAVVGLQGRGGGEKTVLKAGGRRKLGPGAAAV